MAISDKQGERKTKRKGKGQQESQEGLYSSKWFKTSFARQGFNYLSTKKSAGKHQKDKGGAPAEKNSNSGRTAKKKRVQTKGFKIQPLKKKVFHEPWAQEKRTRFQKRERGGVKQKKTGDDWQDSGLMESGSSLAGSKNLRITTGRR